MHTTVRGWNSIKIRNDNGYIDELLRVRAKDMNQNSYSILHKAVLDSLFFYNYEAMKKVGLTPPVYMGNEDYDFLAFLIKSWREWQGEFRQRQVFYSWNGIIGNRLEKDEGFNDDRVGEIIIALVGKWGDERYQDILEEVYGTADNPKQVGIRFTNQQGISYDYVFYWDGNTRKIEIGDTLIEDTDEYLYFIPLKYLQKLNMKDKFDYYSDILRFLVYTEEEIKLKWYQTKLFRWIMELLSIAFMFTTGGISGVWKAIAIEAISKGIKNDELVALLSFLRGNINPQMILKLGLNIKTKKEIKKLKRINEQLKTVREEMDEYSSKALYMPIDNIGDIYDSLYQLPYEALYNYDRYYKIY